MLKTAVIALAAATCAQAFVPVPVEVKPVHSFSAGLDFTVSKIEDVNPVGGDYPLCGACIQMIVAEINYLLNYILNVGVIGDCSSLCTNAIPKSDPTEQDVCIATCDAVGLGAFIEAIRKDGNDIDPIAPCVAIDICEYVPGGKVKVDAIDVVPNPVKLGDNAVVSVEFTVVNETSTGDISLSILDAEGNELTSSGGLSMPTPPGNYRLNVKVSTGEGNNPNQQPIITKAGKYGINFALCAGMCGSPFEHAHTYVNATHGFIVSN